MVGPYVNQKSFLFVNKGNIMDYLNYIVIRFWIPILFVLLSIPLILKMIPPNLFYGIRSKSTLNDTATWYSVNNYVGWYFFAVGTILFIYRLIEPYFTSLQADFKGVILIVSLLTLIVFMIYIRYKKTTEKNPET